MRKIYLLIIASIIISGCEKQEINEISNQQNERLKFEQLMEQNNYHKMTTEEVDALSLDIKPLNIENVTKLKIYIDEIDQFNEKQDNLKSGEQITHYFEERNGGGSVEGIFRRVYELSGSWFTSTQLRYEFIKSGCSGSNATLFLTGDISNSSWTTRNNFIDNSCGDRIKWGFSGTYNNYVSYSNLDFYSNTRYISSGETVMCN